MDSLIVQFILLIAGFVMLIKGADWFVEGASKIAARFGIPKIIIGLTIVAMGTSAPEAAISISAALKGSADIAVGNVVGSNIMNILLILGITAIILPIPVKKPTLKFDLPFLLIVTALFVLLGLTDNVLGLVDGLILLAVFIGYMAYLFITTINKQTTQPATTSESKSKRILLFIFLILIGCVLIVAGSNLTVDSAVFIAKAFGINERIIGLTIIAFGTSLPELVTSVTAAAKGKTDIAVGNIVGSNIFNILFVIGLSAIITPVAYQPEFLVDSFVCIGACILLPILVLNKKNRIKRPGGAIMLLCYCGYFVYLIQ